MEQFGNNPSMPGWSPSSGTAFRAGPSSTTLTNPNEEAKRFSNMAQNLKSASGGKMITIPGPNIPSGPSNNGPSGPRPGEPGWVQPQWTGPSIKPNTTPALQHGDGQDTEFGQLVKIGAGRNPGQEARFQQLLKEFQATQPVVPSAPIMPAPSLVPPAPVASATMVPPPPITGATGQVSAVPISQKGGVGNQPSGIQNLMTKAGQGLQSVQGLAQGAVGKIAPAMSNVLPNIPSLPLFNDGAQVNSAGQVQNVSPQEKLAGYRDKAVEGVIGGIDDWNKFQDNAHIGSWNLPEFGITEGIQRALRNTIDTSGAKSNQGGSNLSSVLGASGVEGTFTGERFENVSTQGERTPMGERGKTAATSKNILGNIPINQAPEAIVTALREPKKLDAIAAGIASEEVKPVIANMMQTAQNQGDMDTVQKLSLMYAGVQRQLNFNAMIQQAVQAISGGFGAPQAQDITAARQPMVEQGIGSALEAPPALPMALGDTPGQGVSQLPVRLPEANVQQNRPPQFDDPSKTIMSQGNPLIAYLQALQKQNSGAIPGVA